ncbi:hypothetical protein B0H17DRAFT_1139226 [Mycena rosella]|uniref:Uncharacterized protein n=1 Tax=Mycena rosella TaxID=1033263 RepID=A0AAD7D503_MYCRO|nr:hypothetical protein B0H17DRAFT_1139226 [Mycena rosella]
MRRDPQAYPSTLPKSEPTEISDHDQRTYNETVTHPAQFEVPGCLEIASDIPSSLFSEGDALGFRASRGDVIFGTNVEYRGGQGDVIDAGCYNDMSYYSYQGRRCMAGVAEQSALTELYETNDIIFEAMLGLGFPFTRAEMDQIRADYSSLDALVTGIERAHQGFTWSAAKATHTDAGSLQWPISPNGLSMHALLPEIVGAQRDRVGIGKAEAFGDGSRDNGRIEARVGSPNQVRRGSEVGVEIGSAVTTANTDLFPDRHEICLTRDMCGRGKEENLEVGQKLKFEFRIQNRWSHRLKLADQGRPEETSPERWVRNESQVTTGHGVTNRVVDASGVAGGCFTTHLFALGIYAFMLVSPAPPSAPNLCGGAVLLPTRKPNVPLLIAHMLGIQPSWIGSHARMLNALFDLGMDGCGVSELVSVGWGCLAGPTDGVGWMGRISDWPSGFGSDGQDGCGKSDTRSRQSVDCAPCDRDWDYDFVMGRLKVKSFLLLNTRIRRGSADNASPQKIRDNAPRYSRSFQVS